MTKTACGALFASVALSALFTASGALAQTQAPAAIDASTQVGEVVVTANKRSERILDVAASVSAVTGVELQRRQILDLQDLFGKVPGLTLQEGGYGGISTRLVLRGLNTGNSGATVATVVDDVPFSLSGTISVGGSFGTDIDSYDLSRVEVLRGPQGTLYGATAEGGLIKYVTNAPDPNAYHAGMEIGVLDQEHGDGPRGSAKGYINIPLFNGTAALRATGFYESNPGWIDDKLAGHDKANDFTRSGARVSFLWKPTQDFTFRITGFTQIKRVDNFDNIAVAGPTASDPFELTSQGYNYNTYLLQPSHSVAENVNVNMEYDLHFAKLQSISSYGKLHYVFAADSPYYGGFFASVGIPNTDLTQFGEYGTKKISQELRLSSEPSSTLFGHGFDWQVGAFYTSEDSFGLSHYVTRDYTTGQPTTAVNAAFLPGTPDTSEVFFTDLPSDYEEFAGYADFTYHFTPKFDIEAGGRVFHNREKYSTREGGALFGFPVFDLGTLSSSETSGTFSVAPRYHLNRNALIYVRVASGYRPGGPEPIVPGGPPELPTQFGSDSTVNYEGGFKGTLLDGKLTVDVAGFYIDWSKVQVSATFPLNGAAYPITSNVGSAQSAGAEWTLSWTPLHGLTLGATGAYTDAHLTADAPGIYAVSGDTLPYVAKVTSSVTANYEWTVFGDAKASVGGGWTYVGERYSDFSYFQDVSHQKIPSYDTFEAQASLHRGQFGVQVYGKNLSDERGVTSYAPQRAIFGDSGAYLIRPRTFGLRVTADF